MVQNKDRYKEYSYCSKCDILVPSIKSVFDEYGWQVAVKQRWEYPRVYDDKGNTFDLQTLVPIRQINRRGLDGTLFEEIREFRVKVFCPKCGKQLRSGGYSKIDRKKAVEKVRITLEGEKPGLYPTARQVKLVKPKNWYESSDKSVGRPKGPDKSKEAVDYWVYCIKRSGNTMFEIGLEDIPLHLQSKVKRRLDKRNEGKEDSNVT